MQQAGRTFKRYQNLLNDKVLRPIKNIVIADAVARGLIQTSEGGKTTRGIFNFGANVSIDLGRESASAIAEFKSGLRTGSDIYAERGADWEASMRQRAIEAKAIQDLAKEYGVPPETISDVVPPEKPAPAAPAPKPQPAPKPDEDEQDDGEEPENAPEPDEPIEPSSENLEVKKKDTEEALAKLDPASIKMLIQGMMGGIELGKYDGIDFTPPQGARDAAKRALDVREGKPASQRGMTPVGISRARDLMNGVNLSPDTVRRMKAFFDRHEVDKKGATWDEQGKGWQAWNGWGGDAGYAWARKVVRQMNAKDEEFSELARPGPKSAAQTPAPPKERIKGSKENPEGTASTRSKAGDIEISAENEEALKNKIAEFKDKHPSRKAPTLGALKKVFRRGAGAFSTSFRPTISGGKPNSRNAWAMARVNKFLKMAGGGEVKESYRKADGDLL
jgi:hypothetical protein